MVDTSKIPIAAKNFIERYADDAPHQAEIRARELLAAGNAEGYATWMLIREEVKNLLEARREKLKH